MQTTAFQTKAGVASRWHLTTVILLLLGLGTATLFGRLTTPAGHSEFQPDQRLLIYLRVAAMEWLLFAYLVFGIRRYDHAIGAIIHNEKKSPRWFSAIVLGIAAAIVWMAIGALIMAVLHPTPQELRIVQSFLPHDSIEKIGFAVMTLTAGFCEEFLYRGYLQQQFHALTHSLSLAILLQTALFAILHITLPWKFAASATAMAIFLGVLVAWKKTLIPAMLAHTLVNLLGGLLSSPGTAN